MTNNEPRAEALPEDVQLQEIDERHDLALHVFRGREIHGWSQEELAERAGTSQPQIARLEAGRANPTLRSLTKIAHALGIRVGELFRPGSTRSLSGGFFFDNRTVVANFGEVPTVQADLRQQRFDTLWSIEAKLGWEGKGVLNRLVESSFEPQSVEQTAIEDAA